MIGLPGLDFTEDRQHLGKLVLPNSPLLLVHHVHLGVRVELLALVSGLREEDTVVTVRKEGEVEADNLSWVKPASEDLERDDSMAVAIGALRLILLIFRQDFPVKRKLKSNLKVASDLPNILEIKHRVLKDHEIFLL